MTVTIWLFLIIAFIIAEAVTSVALVTVWVIPPAIISLIICAFGGPEIAQWSVFVIGSLILLILTRPIVRNIGKNCDGKTNIYSLYDKEIKLNSFDSETKTGTTTINGVMWTVKSETDHVTGDKVKVIKIAGNSLII